MSEEIYIQIVAKIDSDAIGVQPSLGDQELFGEPKSIFNGNCNGVNKNGNTVGKPSYRKYRGNQVVYFCSDVDRDGVCQRSGAGEKKRFCPVRAVVEN